MAITRVQGTKGTSSTATTTIALPSAPTSGNTIVLRFASDDYNATPDTGWQQSTGMEQQTFHGGYLWWRISTGSNSFQYTIGSASGSSWILEEWSGLDTSAPYDISAGSFTQSSANSQTTPAITPTAGSRLLLAMMGGSAGSDLTGTTATFDSSFTADASQGNNIGSTRDWVAAGSRVVTADGATAYSTTGTAAPVTPTLQSRSGLIIAFKAAAAGGGGAVTGSLAATESGSDTASFSGSIKASGSLAATETGSDTAAFSGTVKASGSLAATESGSDSASFSGSVSASGSLAATETGADSASFSGSVAPAGVSGTLTATETGSDTAAFAGSVAPIGSLAAVESGHDTASFAGTVASPVYSASPEPVRLVGRARRGDLVGQARQAVIVGRSRRASIVL